MHVTVKKTILTDANFQTKILESERSILVVLYADWSGSCHIMAPIIEELMKTHQEKIQLGMLDVDSNPLVAKKYGFSALPILLFFRKGKLFDQIAGAIPKKILVEKLNALLRA